MVSGERVFEEVKVGRGIELDDGGIHLLDFLEKNDIGVGLAYGSDGLGEVYGSGVGIGRVPGLPKLHIEGDDFKRCHAVGVDGIV